MTQIDIIRSIEINAPIDEVWEIAYHQFAEVDKWVTKVPHSEGSNPSFEGEIGCGRSCTPSVKGFGKTFEVLEFVDVDAKTLRYRVEKGLPGFVKTASNTWFLSKTENGVILKMNMLAELKGFLGLLMKSPMNSQMGKVLTEALEDMKHYAETGLPHPRKRKAANKWAEKNFDKVA